MADAEGVPADDASEVTEAVAKDDADKEKEEAPDKPSTRSQSGNNDPDEGVEVKVLDLREDKRIRSASEKQAAKKASSVEPMAQGDSGGGGDGDDAAKTQDNSSADKSDTRSEDSRTADGKEAAAAADSVESKDDPKDDAVDSKSADTSAPSDNRCVADRGTDKPSEEKPGKEGSAKMASVAASHETTATTTTADDKADDKATPDDIVSAGSPSSENLVVDESCTRGRESAEEDASQPMEVDQEAANTAAAAASIPASAVAAADDNGEEDESCSAISKADGDKSKENDGRQGDDKAPLDGDDDKPTAGHGQHHEVIEDKKEGTTKQVGSDNNEAEKADDERRLGGPATMTSGSSGGGKDDAAQMDVDKAVNKDNDVDMEDKGPLEALEEETSPVKQKVDGDKETDQQGEEKDQKKTTTTTTTSTTTAAASADETKQGGAQDTACPPGSPRPGSGRRRRSSSSTSQTPTTTTSIKELSSPTEPVYYGSSEHQKMRGRLQKELRKLGVDPDCSLKDDKESAEEDDKPTARPSRSAARLAARKITNVVAKSNRSAENLAAMTASDGEDYSGDGISSKIAQRKASPVKKAKLSYCTTSKAALIENDLMLECAEEALTPCQIDAFRTAVHSYNTITTQIHQLSKRKIQFAFDSRPLTSAEYESLLSRSNNSSGTRTVGSAHGLGNTASKSLRKGDERYRLETVTSKVCRGAWNLVTVQSLGSEQLRPNIVMTQSAPFGDLEDEGEAEMTQLEEEFAIHQLDTDPVPFMVKHRFLTPRGGSRSRHYACDCNVDVEPRKADGAIDGYVWRCSKCEHTWNMFRPEQTLLSWYAKVPLHKFLNVIKSWVLAHSCEEAAQLTGVDTFIVRSIWRSIQELCHKDVVKRVLPLGTGGEIVEVSAAHMDPFVVLAALDRKTNTFRAKVFPAVTTSEVDLARASCAWLARDSLITTRSAVMRSALIAEKASARAPPVLTETPTLDNLLLIHLSDHFGNFRLESSHKPILEGFLYEIEWRRAFGRFGPRECFWRMIAQLLPTSRQGVSFLLQVASQFVTAGGQIPLGVRLPLTERRDSDDDVLVVGEEEEETVVLENYYYARREGERHVAKHKKYIDSGEMFFRCPVCKKVAKNNISIMKHISMHLESNREFNPDIGHLSICRYCFRDLETPYHCQIHVQQVHLVSPEAERLSCKICSLAFADEAQLVYHMKTTHTARDMPFMCKICHFRSSFKHHVIDHFREKHAGCNALQCPFCLDLYYCQAKQVVTGIQGTTKFYSHLFKHMNNTPRTCGQCSLPFIKQKDLRAHREECHGKGVTGKGKVTGCGWSSEKPVLVHQPRKKPQSPPYSDNKLKDGGNLATDLADICEGGNGIKSDAPVNWLVPSLRLPDDVEDFDCRECQRPITEEHFVRVLRCTECHFYTCCQSSFTGHMLKMHAAQRDRPVPKFIVSTPLLDNKHAPEKFVGRCKKCDEKFEDGNSLVKHLVLECGIEGGASIELGKRKAAVKQMQAASSAAGTTGGGGATSAKRRRGAHDSDATEAGTASSGSSAGSGAASGASRKFEDVVGEPFTEVFNTSSSNSVGSTPLKTTVPKQAKGNKASVNPELERFLSQLGLRNAESCSDFKVSLTGPKCVKQQWINMGLVQQEIDSSSESEDENEDPEKKEKREKARKERAQGLLLPKAKSAAQGPDDVGKDDKDGKGATDDLGAADSPPSSSSSSDTSVTDVDLD